MRAALERLPDRLLEAGLLDWTGAVEVLRLATSIVTIGRGPTLAIAREASLKLKETCNLHAEAFSGAEFLHGPIALVEPYYPVLLFTPTDEASAGMQQLATGLRQKGARVMITGTDRASADGLPMLAADHPGTDAICLIQNFYALAVRLAEVRGINADQPRHLQKVTRTR
jgi:glucosamine--fructose-6-phosphate aminotransferase (isomerizing)